MSTKTPFLMRIMPDCDVDRKAKPGNQLTHLKESSACQKFEEEKTLKPADTKKL